MAESGSLTGAAGRLQVSASTVSRRIAALEARSYRKSSNVAAKMSYLGHTLMDDRHGIMADARVNLADGFGEREAAKQMLAILPQWEGVCDARKGTCRKRQATA